VSASRIVYEDDLVQLWHGDYRDSMQELQEAHPDCIITDPPYGETNLKWDRWPAGWLADAALLTDSLWCFGTFRMFHEHAAEFAAWKYAQDVIWEKQNGTGLLRDRFRRVHETVVQWYQGDWASIYSAEPLTTNDVTPRIMRKRASKGVHLHGAVGSSSYQTETGGTKLIRSVMEVRSEHGRHPIHPTQKPLGMVLPLVEHSVPGGGLVVDLFAGSGTVPLAARLSGRRCIAFEIREDYAIAAAARLSQQNFDLSDEVGA
jgi:site-specific DNA-methyltransferase (adenine-specific)